VNYFFTESTLALIVESAALTVESIAALAVSAAAFTVSVAALAAESTVDAALSEELLQDATKAPMAKTNRSFFIFVVCFCKIMVWGFIPEAGKGNPPFLKFFFDHLFGLQFVILSIKQQIFRDFSIPGKRVIEGTGRKRQKGDRIHL